MIRRQILLRRGRQILLRRGRRGPVLLLLADPAQFRPAVVIRNVLNFEVFVFLFKKIPIMQLKLAISKHQFNTKLKYILGA